MLTQLVVLGAFALNASAAYVNSPLDQMVAALRDANELRADFVYQTVGGPIANYSIEFSRPNKARFDTPSELIVFDGQNMTVFKKDSNVYYVKPQAQDELFKVLAREEFLVFGPFFGKDLQPAVVRDQGVQSRGRNEFKVVSFQFDARDGLIYTVFLDQESSLPRQLTLSGKDSAGNKIDRILTTRTMDSSVSSAEVFAFQAPSNARKVTEAELNADRWFNNLDDALAEARSTNRLVYVHFYEDWCGPCNMMSQQVYPTAEFKAMSKDFVFCKIKPSDFPAQAQRYNVSGIPALFVLRPNGEVVHSWVGFRPVAETIMEMRKALQ